MNLQGYWRCELGWDAGMKISDQKGGGECVLIKMKSAKKTKFKPCFCLLGRVHVCLLCLRVRLLICRWSHNTSSLVFFKRTHRIHEWCIYRKVDKFTIHGSYGKQLQWKSHVEPADHLRYQTDSHPSLFAPFLCSQHLMTLWWKKSCTSWYGKYPIIYRALYIPGGAGFFPSTVCVQHYHGSHIQVTAFHSKDCESSVFFLLHRWLIIWS